MAISDLGDPDLTHGAVLHRGRSKTVYDLGDGSCLVELVPSLDSFTFDRTGVVPGTDRLRLDFYEMAARVLTEAGVPVAFTERAGEISYRARYCPGPPFEVIVKNVAVGSTQRLYPGLFPDGHRFDPPVVKFDFRRTPEDLAISEDYVRATGFDAARMRSLALATNEVLRAWLSPLDLWDFCVVVGVDSDGRYRIASEVSPDCMRLKRADGTSLDKDIFRAGGTDEQILQAWSELVTHLA